MDEIRLILKNNYRLVLLGILILVMGCKDGNKGANTDNVKQESESNIKEPIQAIKLPNVKNWRYQSINMIKSSKLTNNDTVYKMSRETITKPSYVAISNLKVFNGSDYEVSVKVKKGDNSSLFGLRIQSIYPNKMDVIFDLDKGQVVGSTFKGDFYNLETNIYRLSDDWYLCSLKGEILYDKLAIVFGPASENSSISTWESISQKENDIYIIPNSLSLLEY